MRRIAAFQNQRGAMFSLISSKTFGSEDIDLVDEHKVVQHVPPNVSLYDRAPFRKAILKERHSHHILIGFFAAKAMRKKSFGTDTCRGAFKKLRAFTALARCSRHEQPPPPQHPLLPARGAQLSPPQPTVSSAEMIFCSVSILPAHGAMPSRWKIVRTRTRTRSDRLRRGLRRPAQAGERSSLGRDRPPKRRFRCHRKKGAAARTIVAGGRSRKPLVSGLIQGHDR